MSFNEKKLTDLREGALRTMRILRLIEMGHRSPTIIAVKAGSTPQLVKYYLKVIGGQCGQF